MVLTRTNASSKFPQAPITSRRVMRFSSDADLKPGFALSGVCWPVDLGNRSCRLRRLHAPLACWRRKIVVDRLDISAIVPSRRVNPLRSHHPAKAPATEFPSGPAELGVRPTWTVLLIACAGCRVWLRDQSPIFTLVRKASRGVGDVPAVDAARAELSVVTGLLRRLTGSGLRSVSSSPPPLLVALRASPLPLVVRRTD
jgi:hypothetical protein